MLLMSPSLFFDNKKYISAKEASRLTGYSKDYIGQLARGDKIDSRRIGRVWYVGEESITNYKNFSDKLGLLSKPEKIAGNDTSKKISSPKVFLPKKRKLLLSFAALLSIAGLLYISDISFSSITKKIASKAENFLVANLIKSVTDPNINYDSLTSAYKNYVSPTSKINVSDLTSAYKNYLKPKVNTAPAVVKVSLPKTSFTPPSNGSVSSSKIIYVRGPAGPTGPQGVKGDPGTNVVSPQSSGYTPIPSYFANIGVIPPNPVTNYSGGSISSATDLSSINFITTNAKITTLTVSGDSTLSGSLAVAGSLNVTGTITGSVTGSMNPDLTLGSVFFQGASGIAQDNANLFWDDTNNALGLGTIVPATTSILDLTSTDKGFLPPRMTTVQKNAIVSPATGLTIFDSTLNKLNVYNGTTWKNVGSAEIGGDVANGTSGSILFVNSSGNLAQDNSNLFYDATNNKLGIGTTNPLSTLSINGGLHVGGDSDAGDNNILADGTITGTQLISNIAIGTAPFSVTSTTPVANLSIGGNAGTVTNAVLPTALTNNGGAGTLTWPVAGATLTIPTGGGTLGTAAFTASTA